MPTLREIGKMDIEELRLLWRGLSHGRAWGGSLSHWWQGDATLCGKKMARKTVDAWGFSFARGKCRVCHGRYIAMRDRLERHEQVQELERRILESG